MNSFITVIIFYLLFDLLWNQSYKQATKNMRNAGALTILIATLAAFFCLLLFPFFEIKFPTDPKIYGWLLLAIIFYAIHDRLGTTVRSGIEASTYNILRQLSTVFLIIMGIFFFKEPITGKKIIGVILIFFSNILIFSEKSSFRWNKYVLLGVIANICYAVALLIDVNNSKIFNLPFYVFMTLWIPTIFIFWIEKIKWKDIYEEFQNNDKKAIIITSISWGTMIICMLKSYQLEKVTLVAPLTSLSVLLNVIVGYFFWGEKDHLGKKIIASILIIISVILIKG